MPVHGEYRMLRLHGELAQTLGMPKENVFVLGNGDTLTLRKHTITEGKRVPTDDIYIDGKDITGLSTAVIRDRNILANDGMVAVLISIDSRTNTILAKPEIVSKGFIYMDENAKKIIQEAREIAYRELDVIMKGKPTFGEIKNTMKTSLGHYLYTKTHRSPMIIPLIMNQLEK
jgi:ribonuclease J